ncbi:hypothetical protein PHYSODRAFT_259654 [Phytophthora sojae]|uniref:Uncharacterized protein n=1 Tax=Phytophthora sojae (strain P6497) TaxID=1094619 RepID=G4Z3W9_PHYSP|nr:hypothetical protein PHYSODRAFT_259654 [Phytophthora sojae]EGZ20828.1 hypothetical protein PHYSODRAFT_259654 [Phytophthora sojae]|eukprot:XP_009523545.1 hypothetical protein PHYSODRAFT_259654 [Phytophthora sojae]
MFVVAFPFTPLLSNISKCLFDMPDDDVSCPIGDDCDDPENMLMIDDEDASQSPHGGFGSDVDKEAGGGDEDARRHADDREEKTAEPNASGQFQADDGAWDGFETAYNVHLQPSPAAQSVSWLICVARTRGCI